MRGILGSIMDLWKQYRFLRFIKKELKKSRSKQLHLIRSAYREKYNLEEQEVSDVWEELIDEKYIWINNDNSLRITARGKKLIGGAWYGYLSALLREKGAPILFLSGVATLGDLAYLVYRHF
jgi:hypothetical protein